MPQSNKPGWIDWVNSAATEIILEDLLPGGYLFGGNDMSVSAAWNYYRDGWFVTVNATNGIGVN